LLDLDGHRGQGPLNKALSELADSVVMGDASSALHDLVSSGVLDSLVLVDHLVAGHSAVSKGEVDVDCGASLVELGNSEADPNLLFIEAGKGGLVHDAFVNALTEL